MIPVSFRGFTLNADGLSAAFPRSFQRAGVRPVQVARQGSHPITSSAEMDAWQIEMGMLIDGASANHDTLRLGLLQAFDTRDITGALIVSDDDDTNPRYVYATCRELTQKTGEAGDGFVATLDVAADQYWQAVTPGSAAATLTASGQNVIVSNDGHLDAYPVITIEPQAAKSGTTGWTRRKFLAVTWAGAGASNHPTLVWEENTTALTPTYAINSTSVGLLVDGVEVNRWFAGANGAAGGFDSTTTQMWCNLDWQAWVSLTLATAISDGGVLGIWANEITVNEDIAAMPETGLLLIENEVFRYRSKDTPTRTFSEVSREFGGTAAAHAVGTTTHWLQHEIHVVTAPAEDMALVTDDDYKPLLDLALSTNASWNWIGDFGSAAMPTRTAQWTPVTPDGLGLYTGTHVGADTDPYDVMGTTTSLFTSPAQGKFKRWQTTVPGQVSYVALAGEWNAAGTVYLQIRVSADGGAVWRNVAEGTDTAPAWEVIELDTTGVDVIQYGAGLVTFWAIMEGTGGQLEVAGATINWLYGAAWVDASAWQTNYPLNMTVLNSTMGESIRLNIPVGMSLFDPLIVDCDANTVVDQYITGDEEVYFDTNYYHGMTKNTHRARMLRLAPGSNTLVFSETGLTDVDVSVSWRPRYYY